jgi:putative tryptophan/tyrosine transport system substrate-binding protein
MRRRDFIKGIAALVAAWPLAARPQQQTMPLVGFLNAQTAAGFKHVVAAFREGLNESGFVEGENVTIEYRWADGHVDRLNEISADLVRQKPAVLVATGGAHAAAIAATRTIPVVASFGGDPVKLGYVTSLNQPGGNVTGMTVFTELDAKRLELLNEIVPRGGTIGYLFDPNFEFGDAELRDVENAGRTLGRELRIVEAGRDPDLDKAFATLAEAHIGGVVMAAAPLFNNLRDRVLTLTTRLRLPAVYEAREFVLAGGLMSCGTSVPEVYRQIGIYTGRILKGEKPADLPVLEPTKFDMAINLRVAKTLGIDMPTSILLRANEVIE